MLGLLPSKADIRCIAETQHDGLEPVVSGKLHQGWLWAVLDGHPAGQPMIAAIDLMAAKSPNFVMLRIQQMAGLVNNPTTLVATFAFLNKALRYAV